MATAPSTSTSSSQRPGQQASGAQRVPDLAELTVLLRLLADPTRLNILLLLARGERNVSSLCDELKLPQPTVSHHLGLLRMSNVINNRRNGKQVFYSLNHRIDGIDSGELSVIADQFVVKIAPKA